MLQLPAMKDPTLTHTLTNNADFQTPKGKVAVPKEYVRATKAYDEAGELKTSINRGFYFKGQRCAYAMHQVHISR